MTTVETQSFPGAEAQVADVVAQHRAISDEPLKLAVYFASAARPYGVFLFEVIDHFGGNRISPDADLFEVSYPPLESFPVDRRRRLHLLMTNPAEAVVAFRDNWDGTVDIRKAVRSENYRVLFETPEAKPILELIRGQ